MRIHFTYDEKVEPNVVNQNVNQNSLKCLTLAFQRADAIKD